MLRLNFLSTLLYFLMAQGHFIILPLTCRCRGSGLLGLLFRVRRRSALLPKGSHSKIVSRGLCPFDSSRSWRSYLSRRVASCLTLLQLLPTDRPFPLRQVRSSLSFSAGAWLYYPFLIVLVYHFCLGTIFSSLSHLNSLSCRPCLPCFPLPFTCRGPLRAMTRHSAPLYDPSIRRVRPVR